MWVRKSEGEIGAQLVRGEQRRKSLRRPLLLAAAAFVALMLLHSLGLRGYFRGMVIFASGPAVFDTRTAILGVFMFAFIFAVAVYNQRRHGALTPDTGDSLLCRDCKKPAHYNPHGACRRGGRLEPFGFFNWVEG